MRTVSVGSTWHHAIGGSPSTSLRQEEQSVTLMRLDPFRELDRPAVVAGSAPAQEAAAAATEPAPA